MIVRRSQEHEERLNRRSAPEVLKALQFRIAEHLLRETARLLPTAGVSTHDNACHSLLLLHYTQYCVSEAQNCGHPCTHFRHKKSTCLSSMRMAPIYSNQSPTQTPS